MSYRGGSQSAEKAGFAGSLLCKALGAHPGISRGVRRVNSKVGSPPWTPILEMASGFLPGEQSCRCLWPWQSSLPPFPFLQTLKGSQVLPLDLAASFFIALGPSPRVQGGGAGEEGREGGMQGKTTCERRRGSWGFSLNVGLLQSL